jgi:multidrug resistance efflux pump
MKRIGSSIFFVLLLASALAWLLNQTPVSAAVEGEPITGSGSIEAETVIIARLVEGRIVNVNVAEGAEVTGGELLAELDPSLLQANLSELQAGISTAQANLAAVRDGPQPEAVAVAQAELSRAEAQRDSAYQVWQRTLNLVNDPQPVLLSIRAVEAQTKQAEKEIERAQASAKTAAIQEEAASRDQSSHAALVRYEIAQKQTQAAQVGQQISERQLQGLQSQLAYLWAQYNNPLALRAQAHQAEGAYHIAEAAAALAQAKLAAAQAEPMAEDVAVAEAQLRQAESSLTLLQVQLDQLDITAPRAGVIATRVANPGEVALPGATLLTLSDLNDVTLTVFIPETQIGQVKLGQEALVRIDSISRPFEGTVTFIANEAEFTPKNVQTQEERVNLVFAVEISLDNADHILKPGMPADAEIMP